MLSGNGICAIPPLHSGKENIYLTLSMLCERILNEGQREFWSKRKDIRKYEKNESSHI